MGCTDGTLVVLSSLPNLRKMKWSSRSFQIAAAQISLVREPCKTIEVVEFPFLKSADEEWEQEKKYCDIIDKALASDNFPSLRCVLLWYEDLWEYFPTLKSRNLLKKQES